MTSFYFESSYYFAFSFSTWVELKSEVACEIWSWFCMCRVLHNRLAPVHCVHNATAVAFKFLTRVKFMIDSLILWSCWKHMLVTAHEIMHTVRRCVFSQLNVLETPPDIAIVLVFNFVKCYRSKYTAIFGSCTYSDQLNEFKVIKFCPKRYSPK